MKLTNRETQIATCINEGCTAKEIAAQLFISHRTVDFHTLNLLEKYTQDTDDHYPNRIKMARWAVGKGLIV